MIGCGFLLQGYAHGVEGLLAGGQGMLIGFATLYGLFWIRVLGAGDVKLFCAIGAFMGKEVWNVLLYTCIFAGGLAVGKLAVILAKKNAVFVRSRTDGGCADAHVGTNSAWLYCVCDRGCVDWHIRCVCWILIQHIKGR